MMVLLRLQPIRRFDLFCVVFFPIILYHRKGNKRTKGDVPYTRFLARRDVTIIISLETNCVFECVYRNICLACVVAPVS